MIVAPPFVDILWKSNFSIKIRTGNSIETTGTLEIQPQSKLNAPRWPRSSRSIEQRVVHFPRRIIEAQGGIDARILRLIQSIVSLKPQLSR